MESENRERRRAEEEARRRAAELAKQEAEAKEKARAEAEAKDGTVTVDTLKAFLTDDVHIDEKRIAIAGHSEGARFVWNENAGDFVM